MIVLKNVSLFQIKELDIQKVLGDATHKVEDTVEFCRLVLSHELYSGGVPKLPINCCKQFQ